MDEFIHDAYMSMAERTIKRLWILCIIIFICFIGSNVFWICHNSEYETIEQEVTQDSDTGSNTFVGGDNYGEAGH